MKKIGCFLFMIALLVCVLNPAQAEMETWIQLGETITVNGEEIPLEAGGVYLAKRIETHEDVPGELQGLENRVITITDGGSYRISGEAQDAQIRVEAGTDDHVRLILDGVEIACRTAPAIAVISAADPREAGRYGVTIELAPGSSTVTGAHTEKVQEDEVKLSGAITSLVSLGFEGEGFLTVDGDNEGIEVKNGHMTFNGGNIIVSSGDDPLNASEDNVSVITVNGGTLHLQVKPDQGGEGDGIDSNGSIVINGGAVSGYAHPDSMDSGIDSDLGCTINGGIVLGMGNMYDEISAASGQLFMTLQFTRKNDEMIVMTDAEGKLVAAVHMPAEASGYSSFVMSSPDFVEGDYYLYIGGEITVENGEAVYTPGTQLQHGGAAGGMMGFGRPDRQMPDGFAFPEGRPEMPENFDFPQGMPEFFGGKQPPQMGQFAPDDRGPGGGKMRGFGGNMGSGETSTIFHLGPGGAMFSGITPVQE